MGAWLLRSYIEATSKLLRSYFEATLKLHRSYFEATSSEGPVCTCSYMHSRREHTIDCVVVVGAVLACTYSIIHTPDVVQISTMQSR